MDYLQNKVWQIAILAMMSFSLLVSLQPERPNQWTEKSNQGRASAADPRLPVQSSGDRQRFVRPARKTFQADRNVAGEVPQATQPVAQRPHSTASLSGFANLQERSNLDDLPQLDFSESISNEINSDENTQRQQPPRIQPPLSTKHQSAKPGSPQQSRLTPDPLGSITDNSSNNSNKDFVKQSASEINDAFVTPDTLSRKSTFRDGLAQMNSVPQAANPQRPALGSAVLISFDDKVKYANSLARRGAVSSSLAELRGALRLLSKAIDQTRQTQQHSQAIRAAFMALDEMSDFADWSHDLSIIVTGHETDVLKGVDLDPITYHEARLAYFGHAEKLFHVGCGNLPLAANAFRSLGKVFLVQQDYSESSALAQAKAMLMFRLAVNIDPQDAMAARELGVLYAKYNHFGEAKNLLTHSLRVRDDPSTWQNLAKIHQSLGEVRLAHQAAQEAARSNARPTGLVSWTNPRNFDQVGSMVDPPVMTAARRPRTPRQTPSLDYQSPTTLNRR